MLADLSAAWLRQRLSVRRPAPPTPHVAAIPAAVLIPIIDRPGGLSVLFTRRAAHLRDHAGQISFPGGRQQASDATPIDTALRESQEEVGIHPQCVEVLDVLPPHVTGTGFVVTPVVGLLTPPLEFVADADEVAEIFEAPLAHFLEARHYRRETIPCHGRPRRYWVAPWQSHYIWGATAAMLVSLRERLV